MKVTTELKNLIKDEFQRKISNFTKEYEQNRIKQYKDFLREIESDEDYIQFKKYAQIFYEKYKDRLSDGGKYAMSSDIAYYTNSFRNLRNIKSFELFGDNTKSYAREDKMYELGLAELRKQEQALLIKLTYEKSLDNVRELLSEYGIEI